MYSEILKYTRKKKYNNTITYDDINIKKEVFLNLDYFPETH